MDCHHQWFPNPERGTAAREPWFCNKWLDFLKLVPVEVAAYPCLVVEKMKFAR